VNSLTRHRLRTEYVFVGCTIALLALVAGIYFGPQTVSYWRLRPFVMRPCDQPPRGWCSVLSHYGYRFEVPWKDCDQEFDEGRWFQVNFKTGQVVRFINPVPQENPISGHVSADFKQALVPIIHESKYQQFKAVMSTVPSQWTALRSRKEFARVRGLLEIKGLWFEHNAAVPDIYSFKTAGFQGFEVSGLSHDWQQVELNLFDSTDHWFRISIFGYARSGVRLTQSEINRIMQSFEAEAKVSSPKRLLNNMKIHRAFRRTYSIA